MAADTLPHLFEAIFRDRHQTPALVDASGHGPTFGELAELSTRFAAALARRNVRKGDRLVAQVDKSVGAVALYLACLRSGVIFVPLNTAYTSAEVAYFIDDAEPALFVSRDGVAVGSAPCVAMGEGPAAGLWAEAVASVPLNEPINCHSDDIAAILYTSGTTGRSKGAMLSHGNLASNALALHRLWGFRPDDVLIHALPIFHVHGLFVALHTQFLNGGTSIFLPGFNAAEIVGQMPRATLLMGVPTFYTRLLAEPGFDRAATRAIRLFISGSAPLLAETHRQFEARTSHRILERYGMTEAGMITSNPLDGERIAGTVGYPLPGVELRIAGDAEQPLPAGEPGVIEIRGPNVFKGYWRNPEKTAEEFRADGWFITGDIGRQAEDGRVEIVGRAKDLIIAGGFNIYPSEIEEAINAIPGVVESAVVGIPHPDLGEAVLGVLTVDNDAALDETAIMADLSASLARFKLPRRILFVPELPRNAMGKVQKAALRQEHAGLFG